MKLIKPINHVEARILKDKDFLTAIQIGRPRKFHEEGTVGAHITNILDYIEKNYCESKYYEDLRILALLHDIGKITGLERRPDLLQPDMPGEKLTELINDSRKFAKKYQTRIPANFNKYPITKAHAFHSYKFAKRFIKSKRLLDLIKYHDMALDMLHEYKNTGRYDERTFIDIFSRLDINLYLIFLKCDKCVGKNNVSRWLIKELKRHGLLKK